MNTYLLLKLKESFRKQANKEKKKGKDPYQTNDQLQVRVLKLIP